MTKEALELALEALEELNSTNSYWWQEVDKETLAKIDPAITAIKEALAQPEQKYIYGTPLLDAMTQDYVPPQRTWVGLTTEDMATCIAEPAWDLILRKADQILKEKNT